MSLQTRTRPPALDGIEALTFDVFGTVVDWQNSVVRALRDKALRSAGAAAAVVEEEDWTAFAKEWRQGYYEQTCVCPDRPPMLICDG